MQNIDVHDLPEPVAKAIEVMVQTLRNQAAAEKGPRSVPTQLPSWPGTVIGKLSRTEIYDNAK